MHWKQSHGEDKNRDTNKEMHAEEKSKLCGQSCQNSDTEDEVVPVEVRPGHIRFEPVGKGLAPPLCFDYVFSQYTQIYIYLQLSPTSVTIFRLVFY